ncbi:hypothetical protein Plhal304r1_c037g0111971 [Plasmopara halstedii]
MLVVVLYNLVFQLMNIPPQSRIHQGSHSRMQLAHFWQLYEVCYIGGASGVVVVKVYTRHIAHIRRKCSRRPEASSIRK